MAAVKDYLKKLLYQYDCVVVPELGAFLTHYQPASFTETSGLYLPPRKRVAFNEALRFDDGILSNYIMLHEPVTREGAQKHISQFVTDLRQNISADGRFELEGIGIFSYNDEGRLQFDPSLRHNFFGEAYGMTALTAQLVNAQPKQEPSLNAVPMTSVGPVLVRDEDTTLTPYRPARSYWRVAAAALLIGSLGVFSYFSVINPGKPLQSSLDPANLLHMSASFFEKAAPVEAVSKPATVSLKPAVKPVKDVSPVTSTVDAVAPLPTLVEKPTVDRIVKPNAAPVAKAAEIASPVTLSAAKAVRTTPYFTVIAGSFSSKRNAMGLRRKLKKAGYADAFIIMPEQRGQLYKVAASGSAVREEAVANMTTISNLIGSEAWIYKN
jgi:hypothetical protein